MKNIDFNYGVLYDNLEKQANEQGYTLKDADLYETSRNCINFLIYRKIATNKQADMMFKKLHKKSCKIFKAIGEKVMSKEKPKFQLENYQGHYVMHCNTEEKAKIFCDFLHDAGKTWRDNTSYSEATYWEIYESDTVYYFNTGLFGTTQYVIGDFIILEFDEFDWE